MLFLTKKMTPTAERFGYRGFVICTFILTIFYSKNLYCPIFLLYNYTHKAVIFTFSLLVVKKITSKNINNNTKTEEQTFLFFQLAGLHPYSYITPSGITFGNSVISKPYPNIFSLQKSSKYIFVSVYRSDTLISSSFSV